MCFKSLFSYLIVLLSIFSKSWSQSSDLIVNPTLTFYNSNSPTVADLVVKEQNIPGTIVWYNQKVGGTQYSSSDLLNVNQSYWVELSGAVIGERLQTKIFFAKTPVIMGGNGVTLNPTDSQYYVCEGQEFTLIGDNLGGIEEFRKRLISLGFVELNTNLNNGNTHFISNTANTWVSYNELVNGDPNISSSVGTPGVSLHMLSDSDMSVNITERAAVSDAIAAQGLSLNSYWIGISQFLNSNEYLSNPKANRSRANSGWFWEDGTYYDDANPFDSSGNDWAPNEPNDFGTRSFNLEEDKIQLRRTGWVDQVGNSTVPARQSGAIIEFNDANGIQWYKNEGLGWVAITNATSTELVQIAGTAGTSIDYKVEAIFNGSSQESLSFKVNFSPPPPAFNIVDNDDSNNPNEEFYVPAPGDTQTLKTDIPAGSLNFVWTAEPKGIVNLTPSGNTVLVEGIASGSVKIENTATNLNGCKSSATIDFEVKELTTPVITSPFNICGDKGSDLSMTDNNSQEIAWYATGDTTTELSGDVNVTLVDGQAYDVYAVIRDSSGNVISQSTNSVSVTLNFPYILETDPTLPDPNNGNPGPKEWSLRPEMPTGNVYDLRRLVMEFAGGIPGQQPYHLFRGIDPGTLPDAKYTYTYYTDPAYTDQIVGPRSVKYDITDTRNPDEIYYRIRPNGFDCTFDFGPIYLKPCSSINLGTEIAGKKEICQVRQTIQLNADVTNLPIGYTILWSKTSALPAGDVTFDNDRASTVNITGTVAGNVDIAYTVEDPSGIECTNTTTNSFTVSVGELLNAPTLSSALMFCSSSQGSDLPFEDNAPTANKLAWFDSVTALEVTPTDALINARIYNVYSVKRQNINDNTSAIICQSISSTDVTINLAPNLTVNSIKNLNLCNSGGDTADFILNNSTTTSEILGSAKPSEHKIRYYLDATDSTTEIINPSSYNSVTDVIEVLVFNTTVENPDCEVYSNSFNIIVNSSALENGLTISSVTNVCKTNDKSTITADVPTGANFKIVWSQDNSNVSVVPNASNQNEVEVTALVDNATTNITYKITDISTIDPVNNPEGCYSEHTFVFKIDTPSTPTAEVSQFFCESGFISDLTATVKVENNEELVWKDASGVEIPASNWGTTALVSGSVYSAIARNTVFGCEGNALSVTTNIASRLNINPSAIDLDLSQCYDGVNLPVFNLTDNNNNILGTESASDYDIGYFTDLGRTSRIIDPTRFTIDNLTEQQTIYTRVFTNAIVNNSCYSDTEIQIKIEESPNGGILTNSGSSDLCALSNNTTTIVTNGTAGIFTSSNPSVATVDGTTGLVTAVMPGITTISYVATSSTTCIDDPADNTIDIKVLDVLDAGILNVTIGSGIANAGPIELCETETDKISVTVVGGAIDGTYKVANTDVITIDTNGEIKIVGIGSTIVTYTVINLCGKDDATIQINIQSKPDAGENGMITACSGIRPTDNELFESLEGTPSAGGTWTDPITTDNINGIYTYTVSGVGACSLESTVSSEVTVTSSPSLVNQLGVETTISSNRVKLNLAVDNQNVMYSILTDDGFNTVAGPQSSTVFEDIPFGNYIAQVEGCGTPDEVEFMLLGFPQFFSPNTDGINDDWNIIGSGGDEVFTIYIYDRFGKLMKTIFSQGKGWDGVFNGSNMPTDEYWYLAVNQNTKKEIKGHFTLIR